MLKVTTLDHEIPSDEAAWTVHQGPHLPAFLLPYNNPPADIIKRDWDFTADRQYVFRTASLDHILALQNLQCLNNPGRGDCAWFSVIELESGNLNSRFTNVRAFRNLVSDYITNHPEEIEYLANYLQVTGDRRPTWKQQLLISIRTRGNDADWEQLHIIAQALQTVIQIIDMQNHQTQNIEPNRSISLDPAPMIQIAYRRHNAIFAYYDMTLNFGH